jgi:uncharacterized domain HDIG
MKRKELQSAALHSFTKRQLFALVLLELTAVIFAVLYPILLSSSSLHQIVLTRTYKAGELSDEDVIANKSYSFIDEYATRIEKDKASASVFPFFSYSITQSMASEYNTREFTDAFSAWDLDRIHALFVSLNATEVEQSYIDAYGELVNYEKNHLLLLLRDFVEHYSCVGFFSDDEVNRFRLEGCTLIDYEHPQDWYSQSLVTERGELSAMVTERNLYEDFVNRLAEYSGDLEAKNVVLLYNSLRLLLRQDVFYNAQYTAKLREMASDGVSPVKIIVNPGDYILKTDEIITDRDLRTIDKINSGRMDVSLIELAAYLVFAGAVMLLTTFAIIATEQTIYRTALHAITLFAMLDVLLFVQFFIIRFLSKNGNTVIAPFLPCFIIPIFYSYITNRQYYGVLGSCAYIALVVLIPYSSVNWVFYYLVLTFCALYFLKLGSNRIDIIYQAFYTSLSAAVVTLVFHFASGFKLSTLVTSMMGSVINVVGSYIIVAISLPLYEHWFNVPTKFKLHELSYTDTPVLNRLNQVALGTFNHSKNVSEMAYEGAKAVNANAELARVGGLYHDIGKSEHPEYFIENQQGGHNLHDDLNYTLSAAIIKSHVRLGIEKGKEAGLPQEVIDIIAQHHGDDVIQYFYNEAVKAVKGDNRETTVNEEDFRYTGERPNSVESTIVMLADCVEAASRTLKKPTSQRYDKLITNIFVSKLNRDQLENAPLSLSDLNTIKQAFIHVLLGRDHQRIKYDDDGDKD